MQKILLTIAIVLSVSFSFAQDFDQTGFHIGLNGGVIGTFIVNQNNNYADGNKEMAYKSTINGAFGIAFGNNFNNHLGVQVEFYTATQGQNYEEVIGNPSKTYKREVEISYVHFPILFKYMSGKSNTQLYFMIGPDIALRGDYASLYHVDDNTVDQKSQAKYGDLFVKTEVGMNLSLGADIHLDDHLYFNVGLRFYNAFSDINSQSYRTGLRDSKGAVIKSYDSSTNFYGGINFGFHYFFGKAEAATSAPKL